MSSFSVPRLRIALCQVRVGSAKLANISNAHSALVAASSAGNNILVLPECWNCPYSTSSFPEFAEILPEVGHSCIGSSTSPSAEMLCRVAKELGVWLVGGSVPEREQNKEDTNQKDKIYNTCVVVNPDGIVVGKHRKAHLFDIDIPGRITFKESDSLSPGNSTTIVDTPWGKLGVGICYDIRFPEFATLMRQRGAKILVYPGAFNMTTGPAHWELLQRARAVDNQCFVATCSPARDASGSYVAWGHSTIVSPWGDILATTDDSESIISAEIDISKADEMRQNIPCWNQKRSDIYELIGK